MKSSFNELKYSDEQMKSKAQGITLVETLIVIGIIAIVAGITFAALGPRSKLAAKQAQVKSDLKHVSVAVNLYRADHDDGLPTDWIDIGYFKVIKKNTHGPGQLKEDIRYGASPEYDISYHTPECVARPKGTLVHPLTVQEVKRFRSRPRIYSLDVEETPLTRASWICKPGIDRTVYYLKDGQKREIKMKKQLQSLSVNLSGTVFFAPPPDWLWEMVTEGG